MPLPGNKSQGTDEIAVCVASLRTGSDEAKAPSAYRLADLARKDEAAKQRIAEAGGVKPLVDLLEHGGEKAKGSAARALRSLTVYNDAHRQRIVEAGGIEPLVALLRQGGDEAKGNAAAALRNLAQNDDAHRKRIVEAGGIEPLVALLRQGGDAAKGRAALALGDFAQNDDAHRKRIVEAGGIEPLVALLKQGGDAAKGSAAYALGNLALNDAHARRIVEAGGIEPLMDLHQRCDDRVKGYARIALANLAVDQDANARRIAEAGVIEQLGELANSKYERQRISAHKAIELCQQRQTQQQATQRRRPHRTLEELLREFELDPLDVQVSGADPIGRGAHSKVFEGRWNGMPVAIKQLEAAGSAEKERVKQLLRREGRALSRVRHPNVVRLYGVCIEKPCLVMPLAKGNLRKHINGAAFDEVLDLRLLYGVARGMAAVHEHLLEHRDLKPENILLGYDLTPWITDFGLSRSWAQESLTTATNGLQGTVQYLAPENVRSKREGGAQSSQKSDVYSFGTIFWEVLCRERAWGEADPVEIILSIKSSEHPELASGKDWKKAVQSPQREQLVSLVEACWAREPAERPDFGGDQGIAARLFVMAADAVTRTTDAKKAAVHETEVQRAVVAAAAAQTAQDQLIDMQEAMNTAGDQEADVLQPSHAGGDTPAKVLKAMQAANTVAEREKLETEQAVQAHPDGAKELVEIMGVLRGLEEGLQRHEQMMRTLARQASQPSLLESQRDWEQQALKKIDSMLQRVLIDDTDCPRILWLQPVPASTQRTQRWKQKLLRPSTFMVDRYRLFFVCPVTMTLAHTNNGEGYEVGIPKEWWKQHGGLILQSLRVLSLALTVAGHVIGLPGFDLFEVVPEAAAAMEKSAITRFAEELREVVGVASEVASAPTVEGASYRALRELVSQVDKALQNTGLTKVISDADRTLEWVKPGEAADMFKKRGAAALYQERKLAAARLGQQRA